MKKCIEPEHSIANTILFVFEGRVSEPHIFEHVLNLYFGLDQTSITAVYGSNIYDLHIKVNEDPDKSLLWLLRERNEENKKKLAGLSIDEISEIHLFFDYDGHDPKANANQPLKMLETFNDEFEQGRLYISYPMVEALQDSPLKSEQSVQQFMNRTSRIDLGSQYKSEVRKRSPYKNLKKTTCSDWNFITQESLKKANWIVFGEHFPPSELMDQSEIYEGQHSHFIPNGEVSVISSIPLFLAQYFGISSSVIAYQRA